MTTRATVPSPRERQIGALTDTLVSILRAEAELALADPTGPWIDAAIRTAEAGWRDAATQVAALLDDAEQLPEALLLFTAVLEKSLALRDEEEAAEFAREVFAREIELWRAACREDGLSADGLADLLDAVLAVVGLAASDEPAPLSRHHDRAVMPPASAA
jgi:hypothetical protein